MDDLNAQFDTWRAEVANPRVHATTNRIVNEAFAQERSELLALPLHPYNAVITLERRITKDGMISVAGNLYSVPDYTRRRSVDVQQHPMEIRIFEEGQLIARHPVLEGKNERRIDPSHRKAPPPARRPAPLKECGGITTLLGILRCSRPTHGCRGGSVMTAISTRIRSNLVGLLCPVH